MNKNWFCKVLALVLVAMLALPIFALAEEVEAVEAIEEVAVIDEVADEEVAEEADEIDLVADDSIAKASIAVVYPEDGIVYVSLLDRSYTCPVTVEDTEDRYFTIDVDDAVSTLSFKSSNKKVITVTKDGDCIVVGPGTATVTVRGKIEGKKSKVNTKIKFTVTDANAVQDLDVYMVEASDAFDYDIDWYNVRANGKSFTGILPGQRLIINASEDANEPGDIALLPIAYNADNEIIEDYDRGFTWKWSNPKVAFFDPRVADSYDTKVTKPYQSSGRTALGLTTADLATELVPVFYKPGTSKLTFKAMATGSRKNASVSVTVNVAKNTRTFSYGSDSDMLNIAKANGSILYTLNKIDVQSIDKVVITLKVYNGTNWSKSSLGTVALEMATNQGIFDELSPFVEYIGSVKGGIKANKTSTITITATNTRDKNFDIIDGYATRGKAYTQQIFTPYQELNSLAFVAAIDLDVPSAPQDLMSVYDLMTNWVVPIA